MCCGCDTSYIVSVHIHCQASIYTLSLCRGHSWRVRLAKQETLTPPGHLVSPLVCRGPWMSTVVLYCWCHSDSASVLLYFTLITLQQHFNLQEIKNQVPFPSSLKSIAYFSFFGVRNLNAVEGLFMFSLPKFDLLLFYLMERTASATYNI